MKKLIAVLMTLVMLLSMNALADIGLNVTGNGTVYMEADLVTASLGVNLSGEDLETLQSQANETIAAICNALVTAGLDEKNISTNYIYISPRYDYSGATEEIIGYSINNTMSICTDELDMIGTYIDLAFAAGANTFDSISFTVKDDSAARNQALELAVQDARTKAETIASASGMQLGRMMSITEGSNEDYWSNTSGGVRYAMSEDAAAAMGTTVRAAQVKVSAKVQVTYDMTAN